MRFYADSMLGKLCRWLRIMGYDVQYATSDMKDDEIIRTCTREKLVLITRDAELSRRYRPSVYIQHDDYSRQIQEFISIYPSDAKLYFSRCPLCNGPLLRTSDPAVMGSLPEGVRMLHDHAFVCSNCGKTYWEGSHYSSIVRKLNDVTGNKGDG